MANRRFNQFMFNLNAGMTMLEGNCIIDSGATAGVRSIKGSGIKAVIKLATGIYKIQLMDSFARYLAGTAGMVSSVTGNTSMGSLSIGTLYIIRTMGSSTQAQWVAAGVPAGVTAAPGLAFVATAIGAGSGTCFTAVASGIACVEVKGDPNLSITNISDPHIIVGTMGATGAGATALIPVAPVDNSVFGFTLFLRNSSVKGKGET